MKQHIIKTKRISWLCSCSPVQAMVTWIHGNPPTSIMQRWFWFPLVEDSYITRQTGGLPFRRVYNLESTAQWTNWGKIQQSRNFNTFGHLLPVSQPSLCFLNFIVSLGDLHSLHVLRLSFSLSLESHLAACPPSVPGKHVHFLPSCWALSLTPPK